MITPPRILSASICSACAAGLTLCLLLAQVPAARSTEPAASEFKLPRLRIRGTCVDQGKLAVAGAEVRLYRVSSRTLTSELVATGQTMMDGTFDLGEFPDLEGSFDASSDHYQGVVRQPGFASQEFAITVDAHGKVDLKPTLRPAAPLRGKVLDPNGAPLADAKVYAAAEYLAGVRSAITDARGEFEISDLPELQAEYYKVGQQRFPKTRFPLRVAHNNLGVKSVWYAECPGEVEIQMSLPSVVKGRVVGERDEGLAGLVVCAQGLSDGSREAPPSVGATVVTDRDGRYRLPVQEATLLNLFLNDAHLVAGAHDQVRCRPGQTTTVPDLHAATGGWITGRVVNEANGQPLALSPGDRLWIFAHSAGRPASGAAVQGALVQPDGTYRLQVPVGSVQPYFASGSSRSGQTWQLVEGPGPDPATQRQLTVRQGQSIRQDFKVRVVGR